LKKIKGNNVTGRQIRNAHFCIAPIQSFSQVPGPGCPFDFQPRDQKVQVNQLIFSDCSRQTARPPVVVLAITSGNGAWVSWVEKNRSPPMVTNLECANRLTDMAAYHRVFSVMSG